MAAIGDAMDAVSRGMLELVYRDFPWTPYVDALETATRRVLPNNFVAWWDNMVATQDKWAIDARLPLMNPFHVVLIIIMYLVAVGVGRAIMSNFSPQKPRLWQIVHNFCMTSLSAFMVAECLRQWYIGGYTVIANDLDRSPNGAGMARICCIFYLSKIPEFADTMIMVAKKSDRQISFLHLYHHTTIFAIWHVVVAYGPGGDAYFSVVLNSFVHVVMYAYYFFATINMPLTFIKPYITMLQMTQFCLMAAQAVADTIIHLTVKRINYPEFLAFVLFFYMLTLLYLFYDFFQKDAARRKALAAAGKKKK